MMPKTTRGELHPVVISMPAEALAAVMRAGRLLRDLGAKDEAIALYENFIVNMHQCELTPIKKLEREVPQSDPFHPGRNELVFSMVRSHPARYSIT